MSVIVIRTILFFIVLTAIMRVTGKRQIGEMQVSEFVTAFLISEMAALPITDIDIPLLHGIIAVTVLGCIETIVSYVIQRSVTVRGALLGEPVILIANGRIIEASLKKARITLDEVFAQIRGAGYRNIGDIDYVILEQNGKMSVLPKADFDTTTPSDLGIKVENNGITHPVIIDGKQRKCFVHYSGIKPKDIDVELKRQKADIEDILYMTCDDAGNMVTVKKEEKR